MQRQKNFFPYSPNKRKPVFTSLKWANGEILIPDHIIRRKNMKKLFLVALCIGLIACLFCGCGGNSDGDITTETTTKATDAPTTAPHTSMTEPSQIPSTVAPDGGVAGNANGGTEPSSENSTNDGMGNERGRTHRSMDDRSAQTNR
jgi:hypothetical protein